MWIGVLWTGLRVTMWIAHVGGKNRHVLLEKSLIHCWMYVTGPSKWMGELNSSSLRRL